MKNPEISSQEGKNDNPISRVESNPRVDQLKKDLKFSFWDFQAKNGIKASVADFANDPSFSKRLSEAKQAGLSMEEMGIAVDFIRDTYGKKVIVQQDEVTVSPLDKKYVVNNGTELKNGDREDPKRTENKSSNPEEDKEDVFLKGIREDLDRITTEADARDKEERKRIENEALIAEKALAENKKQQTETREEDGLSREAGLLSSVERKKQIELFVKNVEKEFSSLAGKFFVKMRQDQYDKSGLPPNPERYSDYINDVYLDVRNFVPDGDDLLFSIRDSTLVCTPGRDVAKVDLASFDLKDLDDNSRTQALLDIQHRWKVFVMGHRK